MEYAAAVAIAILLYLLFKWRSERKRRARRTRRRARNMGHQLAWGLFMRRPKLQRIEHKQDAHDPDERWRQ